MENKKLKDELTYQNNLCIKKFPKERCTASCEIKNGYCIYEEMEFIEKMEFDDYIEKSYPGENIEEKYNHYYYDCFEREESWGSNFDDDEFECFDTAPFSTYSLTNGNYSLGDKDYFTIYEHVDLGSWYFYSKYINDEFRISQSESRLNWLTKEPGWYIHYFGQFCINYISDFEDSCNPEVLNEEIFAPLIDDTLENLRVDENGFEYYRVSLEPFEEEKLFKEELLFKIQNIQKITLAAKNSFNEASISEFKNWFYKYFVGHITTNTEIRLLYNWCDKFTKKCLDITLMYLEEKYTLYFSNTTEDSLDYYSLLQTIAKIPLEAELFEFIEDDHGVFEDED